MSLDLTALADALSAPTSSAIEALANVDGDVVVLGAGGKMGPSLARMARRALDATASRHDVIAVSRFGDEAARTELEHANVQTVALDLLDPRAVAELPDAAAVLFLAGTKFGTATAANRTWASNAYLPGLVAERYASVPTVVFSSGNVYPFSPIDGPHPDERTTPAPIGEYAWSVLARERVYSHVAARTDTPLTIYRLNYAVELRYGVLVDIAQQVLAEQPIDLTMGHCNFIWQGDANTVALASLALASTPPTILNVTGPETLSVRAIAARFGVLFDRRVRFEGTAATTALLSDASLAVRRFGPWRVSADELIEHTAAWLRNGGATLGKPTHFQVRDGSY